MIHAGYLENILNILFVLPWQPKCRNFENEYIT